MDPSWGCFPLKSSELVPAPQPSPPVRPAPRHASFDRRRTQGRGAAIAPLRVDRRGAEETAEADSSHGEKAMRKAMWKTVTTLW